ncbi:hypothetical protein EMIT043CA1_160028 [Pseudomonas brassicacearum]
MSQACSGRAKRVIARLFIDNLWDWVGEGIESGAAVIQVGTQLSLPMIQPPTGGMRCASG